MAFILRISSYLLLLLIGLSPALADSPQDPGTQLAFAATAGSPADVQALLKSGADPNHSTNADGVPALALAALRHDGAMPEVIKALLDGKANIEIEDKQGQTPLYYAAKTDNMDALKLLLANGANAYHPDHQQLTPRDAASKASHKDVVDAIDAFLASKSKDVMQQYTDQNKAIEQRNKQIAENNAVLEERNKEIAARDEDLAKRGTDVEKQNAEIKAKLIQQKAAKQKAAAQQQVAAAAQTPPAAPVAPKQKNIDIGELQSLVYELSYHTCAAEYWRFCRANKQDTGMDREELRNQMEAHKTLADVAAQKMSKDYGAPEAYMRNVTTPSTQQIYNTLARFGSNADRKEEGVGSKKDVDDRCGDIADQWEVVKPGEIAVPGGNLAQKEEEEDKEVAKNTPAPKVKLPALQPRSMPRARPSLQPVRPATKAPAPAAPSTMQPNGMPAPPPAQILP